MPYRLDAVSVLLAVAALALIDANHEVEGGLTFAVAILFRLWPAMLLPGLLLRRRRKAFVGAIVATAIGCVSWVGLFGFDALRQMLSHRDASGWHVESIYGLLTALVGGLQLRFEAGAQRLGVALPWQIAIIRLVTLAVIGWIWFRARERQGDAMGRPALAAVASLILLSPVSSPQHILWLTPWAAIAAAERRARDVVLLMIYIAVFASATFLGHWGNDDARLIVAFRDRSSCLPYWTRLCRHARMWRGAANAEIFRPRDQSLMSIPSITMSSLGLSIEPVDALLIASTTS